jgi:hypothetical protein
LELLVGRDDVNNKQLNRVCQPVGHRDDRQILRPLIQRAVDNRAGKQRPEGRKHLHQVGPARAVGGQVDRDKDQTRQNDRTRATERSRQSCLDDPSVEQLLEGADNEDHKRDQQEIERRLDPLEVQQAVGGGLDIKEKRDKDVDAADQKQHRKRGDGDHQQLAECRFANTDIGVMFAGRPQIQPSDPTHCENLAEHKVDHKLRQRRQRQLDRKECRGDDKRQHKQPRQENRPESEHSREHDRPELSKECPRAARIPIAGTAGDELAIVGHRTDRLSISLLVGRLGHHHHPQQPGVGKRAVGSGGRAVAGDGWR